MQETQEMQIGSLAQEDALEDGMAIHCSTLVSRIPCTQEPSGLQSMRLQGVWEDWVNKLTTRHTKEQSTMQKVQITIKLTRLGNLCQIQKQEVLLLPGCTFSLQPHLSCWKYAFALSSGSREEEEQASRNLTGFSLWITRPPHGDPSPDLCL